MQIDRPFFDKFNSSAIISNIRDLGKSIVQEVDRILNSRLPIDNATSIKDNPFYYGINEIISIGSDDYLNNVFIPHMKKHILDAEPRINDLDVSNVVIDRFTQTISFNIKFTFKNSTFSTNIVKCFY